MNESPRPLSLGEILDRTAQLYRQNFLLFVKVAAVPSLVIAVTNEAMVAIFRSAGKGAVHGGVSGLLLSANYLLVMPVLLVALTFSHAVLTRTASRTYIGGFETIPDSMRETWRGLGRLVWLHTQQIFFAVIIPAIGAVVLVIVAGTISSVYGAGHSGKAMVGGVTILLVAGSLAVIMWFSARYSLAIAACVLEGKTARRSMKRAISLSKERRGGICLVFLFYVALLSAFIGLQFSFGKILIALGMTVAHPIGAQLVAHQLVRVFLSLVRQILLPPVVAIALTLIFSTSEYARKAMTLSG